jgi:hypothetical protein
MDRIKRRFLTTISVLTTGMVGALLVSLPTCRRTNEEARAVSIKQDSFVVRSIDPSDEEFTDLEPLVELIGDRRFVFMTEATHSSGATFAGRQRLIHFLHQRMDFDIIAMETAFFEMDRINRALSDAAQFEKIAPSGGSLHPFLTHRPLFEYVHRSRLQNDEPIQMMGLHPWYVPSDQVILKLREFLESAGIDALTKERWNTLQSLLDSYLSYKKSPQAAEVEQLEEITLKLLSGIETRRSTLVELHGNDRVGRNGARCARSLHAGGVR